MSRGHRSRCHLPLVIELTCIVAGATAALRLFGSRERSRASSTSSGYASSTHPCQRQSVVIALGIEALIPTGRHGVSHKVESTIESGGSYEIPMDGKAIHSFR
ncbi:hypothetical protein GGP41_003854 [Bipolaris sorokiniana]|uniref:Uncharacterized protein n=1 Tax=Cochliobolus sativus TaxID=45130 RepID=A0A8H5ZA18_COCSA|nr:hypothetical protein GGP41_003854 [Bipolaris sorokiniana]